MTTNQVRAELENAPSAQKRETQHQRIVRLLNTSQKHTIDQKLAGWSTICHTTKLATRIGEMEKRAGVKLERRKDPVTRFIKYTATPQVLATLNSIYFPKEGDTDGQS